MIDLQYQILIALGLDCLFGDPRWLPHPVRLIGALAARLDTLCRRLPLPERGAGIVAVLTVLGATGLSVVGIERLAAAVHPWGKTVVDILLLYSAFAIRDLIRHSVDVKEALASGDLDLARRRVGLIVGRDPQRLDREGVARATVESVAESMVDGVAAPLFFAVIAGPLGALLYKATNTLDSMYGYRNERYLHFGWAAARLDDLANFLPARLTAGLVPLAAFILGLDGGNAWRILRRDRRRHASPNSGHSEAAVAGALGIRLGGPNTYFGKVVEKPFIGEAIEAPAAGHIDAANRLLLVTTLLVAALLLTLRAGLLRL